MGLKIIQCTEGDLETIQKIGIETYDETFRSMNTDDTMDKYLTEAFSMDKLITEFHSIGCKFYFLFSDEALVGYLKLNEAPSQSDINDPDSLEIERIYVRKAYKGKGFGRILMNYALEQANTLKKKYAWLGVWEKNTDAIAFYKKMSFTEAGKHSFRMGDEIQSDYIMKTEI